MFKDLETAFGYAQEKYPGCSFSVKEQVDGPTIVSVKMKDDTTRAVLYVKKKGRSDERPENV